MDVLDHKDYLGDGLYVGFDGYQLWLRAENGVEVLNQVALEPMVLQRFLDYLSKLPPEIQRHLNFSVGEDKEHTLKVVR